MVPIIARPAIDKQAHLHWSHGDWLNSGLTNSPFPTSHFICAHSTDLLWIPLITTIVLLQLTHITSSSLPPILNNTEGTQRVLYTLLESFNRFVPWMHSLSYLTIKDLFKLALQPLSKHLHGQLHERRYSLSQKRYLALFQPKAMIGLMRMMKQLGVYWWRRTKYGKNFSRNIFL